MTPRARRLARPTPNLLFGLVALFASACGGSSSVTLADDSGSPSLAPLVENDDPESTGAESESEPRGSEDTAMSDDADSEGTTSGGGDTDPVDEPEPETEDPDDPTAGLSPEEAAAVNQPLLQESDDARDIEVLSVADGSISSLREAVVGDRPVLLWFWAPH